MFRPFKEQGNKAAYIQKRENAKREERESQQHRESLGAINRIADELVATKQQEQRDDDKRALREKLTIFLLFATVFAAGMGDVFFYGQMQEMQRAYEPIRDSAEAAKTAADAATTQSKIASRQVENSEKAVIQAQRAWVGPIDAKIIGAVELEKPIKVVISIRNTGRQPAKNFRWIPEHFVAVGENDSAIDQRVDTSLKFCMGTPVTTSGQVIFPSTGFGSGADYPIEFSKDEVDEGVIARDKFLVAQGCIAYESFGVARHSAFCYFFRNKTTAPEHLTICGSGSDAD